MNDATLFDEVEPAARLHDPRTSQEAARTPGLSSQRRDVLAILADLGDATAYEVTLAANYPLQQNVAARRLDDLMHLGYAEPTEHTRPGSSTRCLRVWAATDEGRKALAA